MTSVAAGFHLDGVGYQYPGRSEWAVQDVGLTIEPGEFVGIVGPNGSGKSTLLKLLAGFLHPQHGELLLDRQPLRSFSARMLARRVAVVPQSVHFIFPFTVEEIVMMGRMPHRASVLGPAVGEAADRARVETALDRLTLQPLAHRSILELSGGERQKVLVARALVQTPQILLLDEPTAFLDLHHQLAVFRLVRELNREQGVTVVAILHDLNLAALFSRRLVLLDRGLVRRVGRPDDVLTQEELDALYGQAVVVDRHPSAAVPRVTLQP